MNTTELASAASVLIVKPLSVYDPAVADRRIAEEFAAAHNLAARQISGQKRLLPRNLFDPLRQIMKGLAATVHDMSSPWEDGGVRIIRAELIPDFIEAFDTFHQKWTHEVESVLSDWDSVRALSRQLLNGAFDERKFPSSDKIRMHLTVTYEFRPVPTSGDFRVDVPAEAISSMEVAFAERLAAQKQRLRDELMAALTALRTKMRTWTPGHSRLHTSMLSDIVDFAGRLPKLMLDPDPVLISAAESARLAFAAMDADELRDSDDARANAASTVDSILVTL